MLLSDPAKAGGADAAEGISRRLKQLQLFSGPGTLALVAWEDLDAKLALVNADAKKETLTGEPNDAGETGLFALFTQSGGLVARALGGAMEVGPAGPRRQVPARGDRLGRTDLQGGCPPGDREGEGAADAAVGFPYTGAGRCLFAGSSLWYVETRRARVPGAPLLMSTKFASPLLGYNNNVRHKGKVFHIQTEDSGVKYGHIITHLFMDGGRILKSVKTSYAEYIGNDRMADIVREMMKQQHKAMFIALRDGKFDPVAEGNADASQATQALVAAAAARRSRRPPAQPLPRRARPRLHRGAAARPAGASGAPRRARAAAPAAPDAGEEGPATIRQPVAPRPSSRWTSTRSSGRPRPPTPASPVLRASDLPPPPPTSSARRRPPASTASPPSPSGDRRRAAGRRAPPPAHHARAPGRCPVAGRSRRPRSAARAADRRYAPTRPAAIFGQTSPQQGKSIFGEDLISDKSLDEVILSYLAEDLDERSSRRAVSAQKNAPGRLSPSGRGGLALWGRGLREPSRCGSPLRR